MTVEAPRIPNLPPMPPRPGFGTLEDDPGVVHNASQDEVAAKLASVASPEPVMEDSPNLLVPLPGGALLPNGQVVKTALVRELNGFDEELLSRIDAQKNGAVFMTELLVAGVQELAGEKPSRDMVRKLLIGDRDALMLGIRKATYGDTVEFSGLICANCDTENNIEIDLNDDVPVKQLEDPLVRVFDVPLRKGSAEVALLTGEVQEAFAENMDRKTQAEINTIMLSKSVVSIRGNLTLGQADPVRALSFSDRDTLVRFINEHQPGPQFNAIPVPCAVCKNDFQIVLGLPNLFRF